MPKPTKGARLGGSATHERMMLRNLLENARRYGGPQIELFLQSTRGQLELAVADPQALLSQLGFDGAGVAGVDTTDGLRITLADGCIVHLRPSGNAPELRCYAEADSVAVAQRCVDQALKNIQAV